MNQCPFLHVESCPHPTGAGCPYTQHVEQGTIELPLYCPLLVSAPIKQDETAAGNEKELDADNEKELDASDLPRESEPEP